MKVFKIMCANKMCSKIFHIIGKEDEEPRRGLKCVDCLIEEHRENIITSKVEMKKDGGSSPRHYRMLLGYRDNPLEYTPRMMEVE